jgi:hypothetical protein
MQQDLSRMDVPKGGLLKKLCRKTVLCRFHQNGKCKRGSACDFAHEEQDVRTKPELQRTKPCPKVANGQPCEDPNCPFAHVAGELRSVKPQPCVLDSHAATPSKESPGHVVRAEKFSSNSSTISSNGSSTREASSDIGTDSTSGSNSDFDGCKGSLEMSCDGANADASWSRQTTTCSDSGFSRQTSDSGLGRQTSDSSFMSRILACSEGIPRPEHKKHKTRMCSFYMTGKCRKEECRFAHGDHELKSRSTKQAQPVPSGGDTRVSPVELEVRPRRPTPQQSCAGWAEEEDEEEDRLVVVNTVLTLLGGVGPRGPRRSASAPPGR